MNLYKQAVARGNRAPPAKITGKRKHTTDDEGSSTDSPIVIGIDDSLSQVALRNSTLQPTIDRLLMKTRRQVAVATASCKVARMIAQKLRQSHARRQDANGP